MATEETFGIAPVGEGFQFVHQAHVEGLALHRFVDGAAVDLGGAGHVVGALCPAFDFQGVNTHLCQFSDVLNGSQVLGVHDVGAVLVFVGGDEATRTVGLFQQNFFRRHVLHFTASAGGYQVAGLVVFVLDLFVVPAAGVGAGALVGVPVVHVTRKQAATGIRHAQGAVYEDFKLHVRHPVADLANFV